MKHCKEWDLMRWTMCQLVQDFFHPLYVKISEMGLQKWWGIPHTMNMVERGKYDMEYYYGILYPNPPTMLGIHASSCSHWFYCLHMDTDNYSLRFHDPLHLYRKISMNSFKILSWKQSPWFRSFFCRNGRQLKVPGDQRDAIHQGPANLTTALGFLLASAEDMEEILPAGGIVFPCFSCGLWSMCPWAHPHTCTEKILEET